MLLLERLSDARRNGHQVLAVVRGSAVNQDGASNGLTAPNGPSQQRVIRQALADGRPDGRTTWTRSRRTAPAPRSATRSRRRRCSPPTGRTGPPTGRCWLGSVKSNIGHTQAAAGVGRGDQDGAWRCGTGCCRGTLHVDRPSPHVDWSAGRGRAADRGAAVARDRPPAPGGGVLLRDQRHQRPRDPRAGARPPSAPAAGPGPPAVGPAGAALGALRRATPEALRAQAGPAARPPGRPGRTPADVGARAGHHPGRARAPGRACWPATPASRCRRRCARWPTGRPAPRLAAGHAGRRRGPAFLFSGQGSQRAGDGPGAVRGVPGVRRRRSTRSAAHLDRELGRPAAARCCSPTGDAEAGCWTRPAYTQPALFAVEVALFRLVESWGVRPDYVVGHSIGELAAAHVAGVLSLADARPLVAARGRLMQALPRRRRDGRRRRPPRPRCCRQLTDGRVSIAAVNGPPRWSSPATRTRSPQAPGAARRGAADQALRVSHAFHSPLMDADAGGVRGGAPRAGVRRAARSRGLRPDRAAARPPSS